MIALVVVFYVIGGFGTVIFVVVVTAGLAVVVVVVLGIAVVDTLVVVVALVVGLSACVVLAVVGVVLTGCCRADTGSVVVARVVAHLVVFVADRLAVVADTGAVFVVVVGAVGLVTLVVVFTAWLVALLVTDEVVSFSVIIAEVEVVGAITAGGSDVCAQPDSRAARMSIAIAFFILIPPSILQASALRRRGNLGCSIARC